MNRPEKLYKYQDFNKNNLAALKKSQIYFSCPSNFNDPYEFSFKLKEILSEDEYKIVYNYILKELGEKEEFIQKYGKVENINQLFKNETNNGIRKSFDTLFNAVKGVCCLAQEHDDLLMWSHYSNGHRGFCLEFDTSVKPFNKAHKVKYSSNIPEIDPVKILINDPEEDPLKILKIKSISWEKEWRILHKELSQLYTYSTNALTGIYFGANMDFTHIEIISLILRGQNPNVKLYRGELHNNNYKVDFREVNYTPHIERKDIFK
jgi:DUF2971 family protein